MQLQYRFGAAARQHGAEIHNPLFDLLWALAEAGSIQHAAVRLGQSYRHFWGSLKGWEETLGEPLVHWVRGQPARLTPFAERLLWAERQARTRLVPHIESLRGELQRVLDEAFDGTRQVLRIDASHDLMLPALQALAGPAHGLHIELRFAGSVDALRSLSMGRCVVAGFHVPTALDRHVHYAQVLRPLLKPGRHKLIGCMRRAQGLLLARGNPLAVEGLADVVQRRLRFASREAGSGTQLLGEHLLARQDLDPASLNVVAVESSHLAAAQRVAAGEADVALGLQAAAAASGLAFVPLIDEDYFLVCLVDALEQPAVRLLRAALQSPDWQRALEARGGYAAVPDPGKVLSLVQALPWWRFRTPKAGG
ncbi:MAG: helix-turn-helix transcriptional regulator [Rubrivivax sp.]|nr:helix-turn-helix transcriptional regulator [Rubrivivax sp.]